MKKLALGMVLGLGALSGGMSLQAGSYLITNLADTTATSSLRGAILNANKYGGKNIIQFAIPHSTRGALVLRLTRAGAHADWGLTGDLSIQRGELIIMGPPAGVTIDATGLGDRVFRISAGASVVVQNVNIRGGVAPGGNYGSMDDGEPGGAIWNAGHLTLVNCHIVRNAAGAGNEPLGNAGGTGAGDGGGIYNSGYLQMTNSFLSANSAGAGVEGSGGGNGGGLYNEGICVMAHCVAENNRSGDGGGPGGNVFGWAGGGGQGGGIYNLGTMTLLDCLITNNSAGDGKDGGMPSGFIEVDYAGGHAGGGGSGGGIYNVGNLNLQNSSVVDNSSGNGGIGGTGNSVAGASGNGGDGGAIFNTHLLNLTRCMISGNVCGNGGVGGACRFGTGGDGGLGGSGAGIYNSGSMQAASISVAWNLTGAGGAGCNAHNGYAPGNGGSAGDGAGILNDDTASVSGSTIFSNYCANGGFVRVFNPGPGAPTSGAGGSGGGVCNLKEFVATNCTISANFCGNGGSGSDGTNPSTSGGTGGSGGGIFNGAALQLTSCTLSGNSYGFGTLLATSAGGGHTWIVDGSGGGICNFTNASCTLIRNSIIAGNLPVSYLVSIPPGQQFTAYYSDADVSGEFSSGGFNLIGIADSSAGFSNAVNGDQVGDTLPIDPLLGPLHLNGGATPTQALLPGSPAIDQGFAFGIRSDQRGQLRPYDFPSIPNARNGDGSDIGAFEMVASQGSRGPAPRGY